MRGPLTRGHLKIPMGTGPECIYIYIYVKHIYIYIYIYAYIYLYINIHIEPQVLEASENPQNRLLRKARSLKAIRKLSRLLKHLGCS